MIQMTAVGNKPKTAGHKARIGDPGINIAIHSGHFYFIYQNGIFVKNIISVS